MSQATLHTAEPPYTPDPAPEPHAATTARLEEREAVPEFVSDKVRPDVVAGLLKEYTKKLRLLVNKASDYATGPSSPQDGLLSALKRPLLSSADRGREVAARRVRQVLVRLVPAGVELARLASAQIEHTRIRPYERVELILRASEFEAALESASEALKALPR